MAASVPHFSSGERRTLCPATSHRTICAMSAPPPTDPVPTRASDQAPRDHITWLTGPLPAAGTGDKVAAWPPRRGRWAIALERVALAAERVVNYVTTAKYNPLYYTGTIAFFLLLIVGLTGLYLFLFFQYGYDASYAAVGRMESQFIARTIRAIHRYASGATVIVTLLHAYRMLFMERFRGPRWLAWLTGVALTGIVWFAGITGYWLIWDERAVLINDTFGRALAALTPWQPAFMVYLSGAEAAGRSWILFLLVLAVHVILFLVAVGFFYLHIVRLKRPKWLPPLPWVAGIGVIMLLSGLLFPIGMLPQGDLLRFPQAITFDPIFLFFLALPGGPWLWVALLAATLVTAALPWLSRRQRAAAGRAATFPPAHPDAPRVRVLGERCTGCTLCALDCPYGALEMVERDDGRPHKYIAREIADRCVSCAICVGSCDVLAITLGEAMPEDLWTLMAAGGPAAGGPAATWSGGDAGDPIGLNARRLAGARLVFTCERHAAHGARAYLTGDRAADAPLVVIPLPCIGAAPPDLLSRALEAGAASVSVVGCPPEDCANREGNAWAEQRLTRQRLPRLRKPYIDAPVTAAYLPPDAFAQGLRALAPATGGGAPDYAASRGMGRTFSLRHFGPALALLAVALLLQILLTDVPLRPDANRPAVVQLVTGDLGATFGSLVAGQTADSAYRLEVLVDGREVLRRSFTAEEVVGLDRDARAQFFHELPVAPGAHTLTVRLIGTTTGATFVLFDDHVTVSAGQATQPALWPQSLWLDGPRPCVSDHACAQ